MACEAEQQLVEEFAAQVPILEAQMAELQSRFSTWAAQMTAAIAALQACQLAQQNSPPPGP